MAFKNCIWIRIVIFWRHGYNQNKLTTGKSISNRKGKKRTIESHETRRKKEQRKHTEKVERFTKNKDKFSLLKNEMPNTS